MSRPMLYTFPRDRQCDPVACHCCFCGGEIYQGETHYRIFAENICSDCYDHAEEVEDDD